MSLFKNRNRRGNAAIFALTLIPMLGFGSLSVDVGMQRMTEVQLQGASEASSMAGSAYLDGTSQGLQKAIDKAVEIGNLNFVHENYVFTAEDVEIGIYNTDDGTFTPVTVAFASPGEVNAVRVTTQHTHDSVLSRFAWGVETLETYGAATSVQPRGGIAKYVDCYLPFAIPLCHFLDLEDGTNPDPMELDLANLNTVGWGLPSNNPNTNIIIDQLGDSCANGVASTYDSSDPDAGGTDQVNLSNGQNNAAVNYAGDIINETVPGPVADWPTNYFGDAYDRDGITGNLPAQSIVDAGQPPWGNNINGVVPIIDHGCGSGFTGSAPIVGWTYAYIYDGKTTGAGGKNLWMQFDFVNEYDIGYGQCEGDGCYGNVSGTFPPVMVP